MCIHKSYKDDNGDNTATLFVKHYTTLDIKTLLKIP